MKIARLLLAVILISVCAEFAEAASIRTSIKTLTIQPPAPPRPGHLPGPPPPPVRVRARGHVYVRRHHRRVVHRPVRVRIHLPGPPPPPPHP